MIFSDIPPGETVVIDANIFAYHFQPHPGLGTACSDFLERVERAEISGITSNHVLTELAHRLMTLEACEKYGWPYAGIAQRLKRHPAEVRKLTRFRQAVEKIPRFGVQVLSVQPKLIETGCAISQETGLLSNDALLVALMRHHGLTLLASHDADFDRVPGLTRFTPT